jgi:hypothetical protein
VNLELPSYLGGQGSSRLVLSSEGNKRQGIQRGDNLGSIIGRRGTITTIIRTPLWFSFDVYAVKATPTVLAWADAPSLDDGREGKSLNGFESQDLAVQLFRTVSLGPRGAVQTRAEVLHDPAIVRTR